MARHYLEVESNTPEALEELAKEGWYPGKKQMQMRQVCIEIPMGMIPKDANLIDLRVIDMADLKDYRDNPKSILKMFLCIGHKKFKIVKEGQEIPVVGKVIMEK